MSEVFKNGSTPFVNQLPNSQGHAGITFDTIGTFGNALIVTLQGSVEGYNAAAAATFTYNIPSGSQYSLEGAAVAPLSYAACPGCLFVTATLASNINNPNPTGQGVIYYVHPGTPSGSFLLPWSSTPGSEPEGLVFVGTNLSCGLTGPNSTQYSYFVSGYATDHDNPTTTTGKILAYTPVQLNPYEGQILVPDEGGVISAFSAPNTYTTFSSTAYQLEGSTIVNCTANGCPATFGYWKHHPFPSSMFVGGVANIGCTSYTEQQLLTVLTTSNAGGNAVTILGHQLIAAIANYDAGGTQTADASAAIAQAVALLCANHVNLTSSFVASSSTLGQTMVNLANTLDAYNSSAPSCEGSGLSAILKNSTKKAS
jgi:hypothetical protein